MPQGVNGYSVLNHGSIILSIYHLTLDIKPLIFIMLSLSAHYCKQQNRQQRAKHWLGAIMQQQK